MSWKIKRAQGFVKAECFTGSGVIRTRHATREGKRGRWDRTETERDSERAPVSEPNMTTSLQLGGKDMNGCI